MKCPCFHVVLSQLVPPKPQTRVFPHGLKNTSDTPVLEWLRKTFQPLSMCANAVNTGINALKTVWILFTFYDFNSTGNIGSDINNSGGDFFFYLNNYYDDCSYFFKMMP